MIETPVKNITLGDFIDNIEKNGYPQIKGHLWAYKAPTDTALDPYVEWIPDISLGGCALGQGYYNTFGGYKAPEEFFNDFDKIQIQTQYGSYFTRIVTYMNDNLGLPIPEIAAKVREIFKDHLDMVVWTIPTED